MKTNLLKIIILIIITTNLQNLAAKVITVPDDFQDIQMAINSATSGDTVLITPGLYKISITIELKIGVSLIGYGADSTILEGTDEMSESDLILVRGQNEISYLQLRNVGMDALYLRGETVDIQSVRISENLIINCNRGINFDNRYKVGTLWIINNTIINCSEGIRDNDWNKVYMYNNIIVNCEYGVNRFNVISWIAGYNNVFNCSIKNWEGMSQPITNMSVDPLFEDTLNYNYHLLSTSPCINAGTPDTSGLKLPVTDPSGNPRIQFDKIDMGVFESPVITHNSNIFPGADFQIYPTVSNSKIYLYAKNNFENMRFEIYNIEGIKMNSGNINENCSEVDISNYIKGFYIVKIFNRECLYLKKIIRN